MIASPIDVDRYGKPEGDEDVYNATDDVVEILKRLHTKAGELGHDLAWFIDRWDQVRLLVTVDTKWHDLTYQIGNVTHEVSVPIASRSDDFAFAPETVGGLGVAGLLRYIENELRVSFERNTAAPARHRRAA